MLLSVWMNTRQFVFNNIANFTLYIFVGWFLQSLSTKSQYFTYIVFYGFSKKQKVIKTSNLDEWRLLHILCEVLPRQKLETFATLFLSLHKNSTCIHHFNFKMFWSNLLLIIIIFYDKTKTTLFCKQNKENTMNWILFPYNYIKVVIQICKWSSTHKQQFK